MFLLCPVILFSLAGSSYGFATGFIPSKLTIPRMFKRPSTNNATKPDVLNQDFSSLVLERNTEKKTVPTSDSESDSSLQKKINQATEPLEQTIANLTKTNKQLKSQLSSLKEVNSQEAQQKQECSAAMKQVKSLTRKLSKGEGKVKSLTAEVSKAEERVKSQTAKVKEAQEKVTDMIAMLGTEEEKVATLQREKLELKTKLDKLTEQKTRQDKPLEQKTTLDKPTEQKKAATNNWASKPTRVTRCDRAFTNDKRAGICYRLVKHYADYRNAADRCRYYKGRLAVLDTKLKFLAVRTAVAKGSRSSTAGFFFSRLSQNRGRPVSFWIGSHGDRYGQITWSDGTPIDRQMWGPGKSSRNARYQCGQLESRMSFLMSDNRCDVSNYFVCEIV